MKHCIYLVGPVFSGRYSLLSGKEGGKNQRPCQGKAAGDRFHLIISSTIAIP